MRLIDADKLSLEVADKYWDKVILEGVKEHNRNAVRNEIVELIGEQPSVPPLINAQELKKRGKMMANIKSVLIIILINIIGVAYLLVAPIGEYHISRMIPKKYEGTLIVLDSIYFFTMMATALAVLSSLIFTVAYIVDKKYLSGTDNDIDGI